MKLPWISRKKYNALLRQRSQMQFAVGNPVVAKVKTIKAVFENLQDQDVCIFVSYSPYPRIKPHVAYHLNYLLDAGVKIIFVVNTDDLHRPFYDAASWTERLAGIYLRNF